MTEEFQCDKVKVEGGYKMRYCKHCKSEKEIKEFIRDTPILECGHTYEPDPIAEHALETLEGIILSIAYIAVKNNGMSFSEAYRFVSKQI